MKAIWAEEYRPKKLDDYLFASTEQEQSIRQMINTRQIPNLLFSGTPGTGKTSLVQCLLNELDVEPMDIKRANASAIRNQTEFVTDTIIPFCQPLPQGDFRVVVLEEFHRFSTSAQMALNDAIEQYEDRVKFIFTCNYRLKIIPAIHSRVQEFEFHSFNMDSVIDLVGRIIEDKELDFKSENDVYSHIETFNPDIRKIINSLQRHTIDGVINPIKEEKQTTDQQEKWEDIWKKGQANLKNTRELAQFINNDTFDFYYRIMYENLEKNKVEINTEKAYVVIAKYLYQSAFVADQDINLNACLIELFVDLEN